MGQKTDDFSLFIPLLKVDEEQRLVYGVMAEEVLDNANEIFDYQSSKPLFEKWSSDTFNTSNGKSKGNVRTMHGSVAAGKLTDIGFDDEARRIECCAKVVDENEWNKVLEGVYTGFSIGGRYMKRWSAETEGGEKATRYTAQPVEVSLVDKPCIPTATFQMIKKDGIVENRLFKTILGGESPDEVDSDGAELAKNDGDNAMDLEYTPTNDELLPVARELAKAANGDDTAWADFIEAARDELTKGAKKEDEPLDGEDRDKAIADNAGADEASGDAPAQDEEDESAKEKEAEPKEAAKADVVELKQVWQTSDGETFAKKAEAIDHENALANPVEPSLGDMLKAAQDKLSEDQVAKADDGEDEGEYGDVEYADPGYQEDKKPRYPIDTAAHVRSAWNYINQEKNVAMYSAAQAKRIKNSVIAAWKDLIDEKGPPSAEKMSAFGDLTKTHALVTDEAYLAKGLWEVSRMAEVLQSLACLQSSLAWEAEYENDGSQVPNKVKDTVATLGTIMIELVSEEVGELLGNMKGAEGPESLEVGETEIMALAASTLGLEKSDADELAKTILAPKVVNRIQKIHDYSVGLGAKCDKAMPEDAEEDTGAAEKMAKFDAIAGENEILKADLAGAKGEIAEAKTALKSLMADIERIKALPMPSAPRTHVIEKGEDFAGAAKPELDLSKMSTDQLADLAIRIAQTNGRPLL